MISTQFYNLKWRQISFKSREQHGRVQDNIKSTVVQRKVRKSIFKELKIGQRSSSQIKSQDPQVKREDISPTPVDQPQLDEDSDLISNDVEENQQQEQSANQNQNKDEQQVQNQIGKSKTFFIFSEDSTFRKKVTILIEKSWFRFINFVLVIVTTVRISLITPLLNPNSQEAEIFEIIYYILTIGYIIQTFLYIVAYGLKNYFKKSLSNVINCLITILDFIFIFIKSRHPVLNIFSALRILDFITLGAYYSKGIQIAQVAILNAFAKMMQLSIFCFFIFIVYGTFAMKLLKGTFYYCYGIPEEIEEKTECMDYGGSWVNGRVNFDNILESSLMLFLSSTTESWLPLLVSTWDAVGVDKQPKEHYNQWWALYFQFFFFIGNIVMLTMFIGLIVNTYQDAKLRAQNLHLLDENQKEWFEIKHSIYQMKPKTKLKSKKPTNKIRQILFILVKNKNFKIFWLVVIFMNTIVLSLYYHRQSETFKKVLDYVNLIFICIFAIEIISRFIAKDLKQYFKDIPNLIDIIGIWFCLANFFLRNNGDIDFYFRRCFNAVCIAYQLTRNFRIIKRFNTIEDLFGSIFTVIPSAMSMLYIMLLFLVLGTNLAMDLFSYVRPQRTVNGWDVHFRSFSTAMFSLIRVASSEQWWKVLIDSTHQQSPDFACIYISNYDDYIKEGFNGCGTKWGYAYFIFFELIFSLMIMNLFIASVIMAYEEHAKSEKQAISKYQLNDVVDLWARYDPDGSGYINYKLFWKLSSEIAIIFGVEQSDLLDVNNKKNFLKVLNIPIFEEAKDRMLCYKFHDVILGLTKISVTLKYGVMKFSLEPSEKEIQEKINEQFHHFADEKKKFNSTPYFSGDMVTIIYIQRKFREWRQKSKSQKMADFGDLNALLKGQGFLKRVQEQIEAEAQLEQNQKVHE